jgi:hypothetical protein
MVRVFLVAVLCGTALAGTTLRVTADPEGCRDAVDAFNNARSSIADSVRRYGQCVSSSDGHDDCSSEFSTLRSDQDDLESAVSNYEGECS